MSLNPLAPAFLRHHRSSSDLCKSTTMSLPLAKLFCGAPPQIIPSHAPSINQQITDDTLLHPLLQPTNQFQPDAATHHATPGSSTLLSLPLQHQANCLQAIHKAIQQFSQHLKAEHLDRQTLQLIALQLQNDFALLCYLLFSQFEIISNKDTSVKISSTSPLFHPNPNPNLNPNPTSSAFPLPGPGEPKLRRSTPVGAVGPHRAKTNNSSSADFQPNPNTEEAPPLTTQNLTSRISKLEKIFADGIATYTSIAAGIHSQYFFLYDKIRQLEPGNSYAIIWKIPSLKFVFDSSKVARPSSDPLIEPATSFSSPIFRTHRHGYNSLIKFYPYGIGPATGKCASTLFTLFTGDYDNLLQWPFSKLIHIGVRDRMDPLNTWTKQISLIKTRPTRNPQFQRNQELQQSAWKLYPSLQTL